MQLLWDTLVTFGPNYVHAAAAAMEILSSKPATYRRYISRNSQGFSSSSCLVLSNCWDEYYSRKCHGIFMPRAVLTGVANHVYSTLNRRTKE